MRLTDHSNRSAAGSAELLWRTVKERMRTNAQPQRILDVHPGVHACDDRLQHDHKE